MPDNKTNKAFTRSRLIKELSWSCELPQTSVKLFLEKLVEIAKREAKSSFVIPGLCKLDVVRRKSRKVRNPRTLTIEEFTRLARVLWNDADASEALAGVQKGIRVV